MPLINSSWDTDTGRTSTLLVFFVVAQPSTAWKMHNKRMLIHFWCEFIFLFQCAPALSMARRDFPVPLAPFGTRRNGCAFASGCGTPRPPCGRAARASGACETLAHNGLTALWAGRL